MKTASLTESACFEQQEVKLYWSMCGKTSLLCALDECITMPHNKNFKFSDGSESEQHLSNMKDNAENISPWTETLKLFVKRDDRSPFLTLTQLPEVCLTTFVVTSLYNDASPCFQGLNHWPCNYNPFWFELGLCCTSSLVSFVSFPVASTLSRSSNGKCLSERCWISPGQETVSCHRHVRVWAMCFMSIQRITRQLYWKCPLVISWWNEWETIYHETIKDDFLYILSSQCKILSWTIVYASNPQPEWTSTHSKLAHVLTWTVTE